MQKFASAVTSKVVVQSSLSSVSEAVLDLEKAGDICIRSIPTASVARKHWRNLSMVIDLEDS